MSSLFILLIFIYLLNAVVKGNRKAKTKASPAKAQAVRNRQASHESTQQKVMNREELKKILVEQLERQKAEQEKAAAAKNDRPRAIPSDHEPLGEGESHVLSTSNGNVYMGSLHEASTEGDDLCDPNLAHERDRSDDLSDPDSVYAGEIGHEPLLDYSRKGLLQGIVMSEILTRPANRARGMR